MTVSASTLNRPIFDRDLAFLRRLAAIMVGVPALATFVAFAWTSPSRIDWMLFAVFFGVTLFGVEGGFHRYFSHKCCVASPFVVYLLGIAGSMASQGPLVFWTATHLVHHQFSDRAGDPHSPCLHRTRLRGIVHAQLGWLFVAHRIDWKKYALHLLRRRDVMFIHRYYFVWVILGLVLPAAIAGIVEGSLVAAFRGMLWGGLVRIFALHQLTWAVNSLAHHFGTRPYATHDNSRNLAILALPTGGGSWHNNHHAYPAMARNDHRWWQLDFVGYVFEVFATLGLVTKVHRPARFAERGHALR